MEFEDIERDIFNPFISGSRSEKRSAVSTLISTVNSSPATGRAGDTESWAVTAQSSAARSIAASKLINLLLQVIIML